MSRSVGDLDLGQGIVPHPLGLDRGGLGLDLLDQVVAREAAEALGKGGPSLLGQLVGLEGVALCIKDLGPVVQGPGCDLVAVPLVHEPVKGCNVPIGLVGANGPVVPELEPVQVRVDEGGLVRVVLMEGQQGLVQTDGLECGGSGIRGLGLPLQEILHGPKIGPSAVRS